MQKDREHLHGEAIADSVAWANLGGHIQSLPDPYTTSSSTIRTPTDMTAAGGIPSSVLAIIPHLQIFSFPVQDPVLAQTWELH